jgi:hypothetical protein
MYGTVGTHVGHDGGLETRRGDRRSVDGDLAQKVQSRKYQSVRQHKKAHAKNIPYQGFSRKASGKKEKKRKITHRRRRRS